MDTTWKVKIMDKSLVPSLQRELENLDEDEDSQKSAIKAIKSYVKDLDSKAIPNFLAQIYEAKENGSLSGEYTISVYEDIARYHGPKIVPYIGSIMSVIVKTLASTSGSLPLQQACSRVVSATARYAIDPPTPVDRKRCIIHSLCEPLSDSLPGSQESLASGSALCLKVLVESNNWRFTSNKMVNKVCQNVAGALEKKFSQTKALMDLIMALAKHNPLVVEAYARLLIQSGLRILNAADGNSQNWLVAIQMLNFLMKCLDPRSIYSEVEIIIAEMEKFQSDRLAYVKRSAYEALQTAKKIACEEGLESENGCGLVTGLNFRRGYHCRRRNSPSVINKSSASLASELQTLDYVGSDGRSVNQTLWRYERGGENVSQEDGLLCEMVCGGSIYNSTLGHCEHTDNGEEYTEESERLSQRSGRNGPSAQESISQVNVCNVKHFTNLRNHIRSLQDPSDANSELYRNQARMFRSRHSECFEWSPAPIRNVSLNKMHYNVKTNATVSNNSELLKFASESVSSTKDGLADTDAQEVSQAVLRTKTKTLKFCDKKKSQKTASGMILSLFFTMLAVYMLVLQISCPDVVYLVPT